MEKDESVSVKSKELGNAEDVRIKKGKNQKCRSIDEGTLVPNEM